MYTQTASLISTATVNTITSDEVKEYVNLLLSNKESKYVENIINRNTLGMAINETSGWGNFGSFGDNNNFPVNIRIGYFGFFIGNDGGNWGLNFNQTKSPKGINCSFATFRPVIWNID